MMRLRSQKYLSMTQTSLRNVSVLVRNQPTSAVRPPMTTSHSPTPAYIYTSSAHLNADRFYAAVMPDGSHMDYTLLGLSFRDLVTEFNRQCSICSPTNTNIKLRYTICRMACAAAGNHLHVQVCPLRGAGAVPGSSSGIQAGASSPSSPKPLRVQRSLARLVLFSPPNTSTLLSTRHMQWPYRAFGRIPFTFSSVHTDLHTARSHMIYWPVQSQVVSLTSRPRV